MKAHTGMKILIIGIQLAIVGLLVFSFYPVIDGGLDVDIEDDLVADIDPAGDFTVSGSVSVTSKMPWDIDLSYRVILGDENNIIGDSGLIERKIASNSTVTLDLTMKANVLNVVLMMMDNSLDENGEFGDIRIPLQIQIRGSYILNIVSLDLNMQLESNAGTLSGMGGITPDGKIIMINGLKFTTPPFLGDIGANMDFELCDKDGNPLAEFDLDIVDNGDGTTTVNLNIKSETTESIIDTLKNAVDENGELTLTIGGVETTLNASETQMLIDLLTDMTDKLKVVV